MTGKNTDRAKLSSRLGFLLLSAGCSIGLGNIWRFPFVTGEYGGAVFLFAYFFFLFAVGLPILIMEFAMGRASRKNMGLAFTVLNKKSSFWDIFGSFGYLGSFTLMMFYVPVVSWLLSYCYYAGTGALESLSPREVASFFNGMLSNPTEMYIWSLIVLSLGFLVCALGVRQGVEKVVKFLMIGLLVLLIVLAINSLTLSGAKEGMAFYLLPDWERAKEAGIINLLREAMNQSFFTLSVGIGSMLIFGSYLNKERTLTGEATYILCLDTFVAIMAGIIIFPACFTFGVQPNAGPSLIFITLPNVFNIMDQGSFWALLFFIFMTCAGITTVIAVFENIISYSTDVWGWSRKKAILVNFVLVSIFILPCIFGFNLWQHIQPLGRGTTILDFEDFIVSNNILPLGSLVILFFCTTRYGWGFKNFKEEADQGEGPKFPKCSKFLLFYLTYVLPLIILFLFVQGYSRFF